MTGAGEGGGPHVQVFDAATGAPLFGFFAYAPGFTGGVRVAAADLNGDGVPDVITSPGPGGGPHVRVFDGAALQKGQVVELVGLLAYNPAFSGGVYIAAAARASDTFQIVHHSGAFNAVTEHNNTATCPAGKRALAGGGSTDAFNLFLTDITIGATTVSVRWESDNNVPTTSGTSDAWVLCAPA